MKQKTYISMDYSELDALVNETWPAWKNQFESIAEFEWNNCEDHATTDIGRSVAEEFKSSTATKEQIDEWSKNRLKDAMVWASGKRPMGCGIHQLLEALYDEGVLEPGNYLIHVFW